MSKLDKNRNFFLANFLPFMGVFFFKQVLQIDVLAHKSTIETVNKAGNELVESSAGEEASSLQSKLESLNLRWKAILEKTEQRKQQLEMSLLQVTDLLLLQLNPKRFRHLRSFLCSFCWLCLQTLTTHRKEGRESDLRASSGCIGRSSRSLKFLSLN